jgi:DNA-binding response OmpR family regulator
MAAARTILIVEDDPGLRRMYRTALSFAGFTVQEAGDGVQALRSIDEAAPDLIVLDLMLPTVGGFEVQADVAARARTRHIPIVVVTGATSVPPTLDVACVLRKPITPDDLVAEVRRCLGI